MTSFASEIWEQPQALRDTLDGIGGEIDALAPLAEKLRQGHIQRVMLTGMGSSYYALVPSVIYLMRNGVTALAIESSELLYYYPETLDARTLLVAVSQSGASVEVRRLVEELKREATLVGVTNIPDSPLERASDVRVHMRAGEETVSSKSYVCSLAALHLLARGLVGDDLTDSRTGLRRIADAVEDWLPDWSARADEMVDWFSGCRFIEFLGRGASCASAMTGALISQRVRQVPDRGLGRRSVPAWTDGTHLARTGRDPVRGGGSHAPAQLRSRLRPGGFRGARGAGRRGCRRRAGRSAYPAAGRRRVDRADCRDYPRAVVRGGIRPESRGGSRQVQLRQQGHDD
ncbi:MAG: SIS domain-containing protein [Anaerolineae bacterium]